jgi:saccharopine dehydrogenase (NAD+, L-lysine-forming)
MPRADAGVTHILIIGAGGVGAVVAHKCAMMAHIPLDRVTLASRTLTRCESVRNEIERMHGRTIDVATVDADDVDATVGLIRATRPDVLVNVALPYQDLSLMEACLAAGVDYVDTANYEPRDVAKFEYKWQWAYRERFVAAGRMALLGAGFDPGVTNAFCAYAQKHLFDEIHAIDIVDCNGGSHGEPFATNFNPEINLREITQNGRYWEDGRWVETKPLEIARVFDFPGIGERKAYLLHHEELESLVLHVRGLRRIRFWMTFSDEYLTHLRVLQNVGLTRIDPVDYDGTAVVPLRFLQRLLPDPAGLGARYTGKVTIGCLIEGTQAGRARTVFIHSVSDHARCYEEVHAHAVSYTAGVPAAVAARLVAAGAWRRPGVVHMEEMDPDPFLESVAAAGLPWHVEER